MQTSKIVVLGLTALGIFAACGVDAIDLADKTCPCPSELVCDPVANRCVPPGSIKPVAVTPICTPKSCDQLGTECGSTDNGCGGALDCGACALPNTACNGVSHKCDCVGRTCEMQGAECGEVPSGCGQVYKCADCPAATPNCGGAGPNKCGTAACVPATCASLGACGTISDGCGKVLDCGGCAAPQVCGGGGVANKCGCAVKTCAQVGWQCGAGPDNCGGTRDCLACTGSNMTCDVVNHVCKCTPLTCQTAGWQCGTGSDGCGGVLTCPACNVGLHCTTSHHCDD